MGPPPRKKPKKAKQVKTPKPRKDPKPQKPKKGKKSKKAAKLDEPSETPQTCDPGQTLQLGEPGETPLMGYPEGAPLIGEQDPAPSNAPVPTLTPRLGNTDPLEGETPPLRPETEPLPLEMNPGQAELGAIPQPYGPAPPLPPLRQPNPPLEPQPQPKPPMPPRRATPPSTPGPRTTPGGETDPPLSRNLEMGTVQGKTQDILPQIDQETETEMTALPPAVTEGTVVMGTVQRAVAMGTVTKIEAATMMMTMTSPDTVTWEQAARRQAKGGMPPRKTRLLRCKNCRQRAPERRGPQPPNHLPKVLARGKERSLIASFWESSRTRHNIQALA